MKTILLLFLFCTMSIFAIKAQTITRNVVANAGEYFTNSSGSLSWTLGETAVDFLSVSGASLSQGFQQGESLITGIDQFSQQNNGIRVFPNPATESFRLMIENQTLSTYNVTLTDMLGKVYLQKEISGQGNLTEEFMLTTLASGLYFLQIQTPGKDIQTIKIAHLN